MYSAPERVMISELLNYTAGLVHFISLSHAWTSRARPIQADALAVRSKDKQKEYRYLKAKLRNLYDDCELKQRKRWVQMVSACAFGS